VHNKLLYDCISANDLRAQSTLFLYCLVFNTGEIKLLLRVHFFLRDGIFQLLCSTFRRETEAMAADGTRWHLMADDLKPRIPLCRRLYRWAQK